MAIQGNLGAVYAQDLNPSVVFTDEATTANVDFTRYTITDVAKRYWDRSATVTVKKNGVVQTSGYKIEYAGGVVVFDSPLLGTDVVVVSGKYFNVVQVGGFFNWSIDVELDTQEATTFSSGGWKEFAATLKSFSGSAEAYWANDDFLTRINNGTEVVIVFFVDDVNDYRYEGHAIITSSSIETAVDGIVQESIEIQGTTPLYYREG